METTTSRDGTTIAYDRLGDGPAVVIVDGATALRGPEPTELEQLLAAAGFTTYHHDRRGRGDSGDTLPYAIEREIEDIAAVIAAAGGSAYLYGMSSGGQLAIRAARALPEVGKVAVYEPPIIVDDSHAPLPTDYVPRLDRAVAEGRPGDAVSIFLTDAVGMPADFVGQIKQSPMWPGMEKVGHTIAYDGRIVGDSMSGRPLDPSSWGGVSVPALVVAGGASGSFMRTGGEALAGLQSRGSFAVLPGQDHNVDAKQLAPLLIDFFRG